MNLFNFYSGKCLDVSEEIHSVASEFFPNVDLCSEYRAMDSWLYTRPSRKWPKNPKRFVLNWLKRVRINYTEEMRAELHVGEGPSDRRLR